MKRGILYGVGLGPGDPDLLTIKGKKILEKVDTIFYPRKSPNDKGVAQEILGRMPDLCSKKTRPLTFPMVNDKLRLKKAWSSAAKEIAELLLTGMDAAFITEGDPLFFSTFCYLMETMEAEHPGIETIVVPGITAFTAASARGKKAVGRGMGHISVIPATSNLEMIEEVMKGSSGKNNKRQAPETMVLMKIKSVFNEIVSLLEQHGRSFLFVEKCSMPGELIITEIDKLKQHKPDYFSLLIITVD